MAQYSNSTAEVRAYIDRMVRFSGDVVPRLSQEDENVKGLIQRLREQEWQQLGGLGCVPRVLRGIATPHLSYLPFP